MQEQMRKLLKGGLVGRDYPPLIYKSGRENPQPVGIPFTVSSGCSV